MPVSCLSNRFKNYHLFNVVGSPVVSRATSCSLCRHGDADYEAKAVSDSPVVCSGWSGGQKEGRDYLQWNPNSIDLNITLNRILKL